MKKYILAGGLASILLLGACGSEELSESESQTEVQDEHNGDLEGVVNSKEVEERVEDNVEKEVEQSVEQSEEQVNKGGSSQKPLEYKSFKNKPDEAINFAQSQFNGELEELQIEKEDNNFIYEVKLKNSNEEYEVKLSVNELIVLSEERDNDDSDLEDTFNYSDMIPYDKAIDIAINEVGGEFKDLELDKDDGIIKYEIELTNEFEVEINAETSEIVGIDD